MVRRDILYVLLRLGAAAQDLAQWPEPQHWPLPPSEAAPETPTSPAPAPPARTFAVGDDDDDDDDDEGGRRSRGYGGRWNVRPETKAGTAGKKVRPTAAVECPDFAHWSTLKHAPFSGGRHNMSHQRPSRACRRTTFVEVEDAIEGMRGLVRDPDLFQLFRNCFPNTLDTAIKWRGFAAGTEDEELTYITTGDIDAMWLRDSANQLQSYKSLLRASESTESLASLFRGAINLQARYIRTSPHCNAFRAPPEVGPDGNNNNNNNNGGSMAAPTTDYVKPWPPPDVVFECKWELDSLAAFLQLSHEYLVGTGDWRFFGRHGWVEAVEAVLRTTRELTAGTYDDLDGAVRESAYRFQRQTSTSTETLANGGEGHPVRAGTGLVRSAFRPSDDATVFQLLVPANMMFSRYLALCADLAARLERAGRVRGRQKRPTQKEKTGTDDKEDTRPLSVRMATFADEIRAGIEKHARTRHAVYGDLYAYEIDGSGSHSLMDDANLPSLLGAALMGYVERDNPAYQNTRRFVLSKDNPYYMRGPVLNGTGGPHVGPGMAWPMSVVVRIMTSDDDAEIVAALRQLVASTDGYGLMHESVSTFNANIFTRPWFSWANGLFGQMMLDLKERKPHLLSRASFQ